MKPVHEEEKHMFIERDRIITANTRRIFIENKTKRVEVLNKQYQVLEVFTKLCNKWFMIEQKQL